MSSAAVPQHAYTALRVERPAPGVALVRIDHGPINLMDRVLYADLRRVAPELAADESVRAVVVVSDNPEFFIAHFDVELILAIPAPPPVAADAPSRVAENAFHAMTDVFRTMPKPTIAVIEGRVGGGGAELAMAMDMRFASTAARFNQPEVALGILPGGTGTQRLPRHVGRARALEMILGCVDVDADTAERWGLVNRTLPRSEVRDYALALAARIAGFPPHAVASAKASVLQADGPTDAVLADALSEESRRFSATLSEPDTRSAMAAFLMRGGQTPEGERRLADLVADLVADLAADPAADLG